MAGYSGIYKGSADESLKTKYERDPLYYSTVLGAVVCMSSLLAYKHYSLLPGTIALTVSSLLLHHNYSYNCCTVLIDIVIATRSVYLHCAVYVLSSPKPVSPVFWVAWCAVPVFYWLASRDSVVLTRPGYHTHSLMHYAVMLGVVALSRTRPVG